MEFRDLKYQYQVLKSDIDHAVLDVMQSGAYIMGQPVKELEAQLADYVGVKHCISCANGTDALTLALKAWGIGKGDAVFVPDFTFFASAEVVGLEGATPVFVDVDAETFNISPTDLERAILDLEAEEVITVHHDKFALSTHAWTEPDSVAQSIAKRHSIRLLDQPIGTVIYF